MKKLIFLASLVLFGFLVACTGTLESNELDYDEATSSEEKKKSYPVSVENGKFFDEDGKQYLYGGEDESQHFDITGYSLKDEQFHFGIGREKFPALLVPEFINRDVADTIFADSVKFLLLNMDGITKAYSIEDLTRHEVVNDMVNGKPVMAVYCILADLGAVYDRSLADKEFTFALSGYTYHDDEVWDGMDGFVLWDRETESLWWPLIGESVSGPMQGSKMKVLPEEHWLQTTWGEIKQQYEEVQVLKPGQDFDRPTDWIKYDDIQLVTEDNESVAPRWGENKK